MTYSRCITARQCVWSTCHKHLARLLLVCLLAPPVNAAEWPRSVIPDNKTSFLAGFAGGIAAHELGHVTIAAMHGYTTRLDGPSLVYSPQFSSRSERLRISSAGFQSQWLAAEAAFAYREKAPDFAAGVISAHLAVSLTYLAILRNHPQGDTLSAARASRLTTGEVLMIGMVPALLDGWRLADRDVPGWVAPLSIGFKGGCITAIWNY